MPNSVNRDVDGIMGLNTIEVLIAKMERLEQEVALLKGIELKRDLLSKEEFKTLNEESIEYDKLQEELRLKKIEEERIRKEEEAKMKEELKLKEDSIKLDKESELEESDKL